MPEGSDIAYQPDKPCTSSLSLRTGDVQKLLKILVKTPQAVHEDGAGGILECQIAVILTLAGFLSWTSMPMYLLLSGSGTA